MKLFIIHHAHTDIGYTDRQEKIEWHHVKYLESVIQILREAEHRPEWNGYKWVAESFWCVEKFLQRSTADYITDFWRYVREGKIGLSGNYLNCTDLLDDTILRQTLALSQETTAAQGVSMTCGMSADINGYGWGYASALADAGVTHLLANVHTHHGYHVCGKKQFPFYWVGPDGKKILVWQGEHYHLGCELLIHQLSGQFSYMVQDGLANTGLDNWDFSKERIFAYVRKLKEDGYPFDFCPITVSGLCTDNSPPGPKIIEFIHRWNETYGNEIPMEMSTLETFFAAVEQQSDLIPTYSGDWTDWWADGTCSTPNSVKHYREAVRNYHICRNLDPDCKIVDPQRMETARYNLMFYSEHTWGFSSSVSEPYHPLVNNLDQRKTLYAAKAHEALSYCCDMLCEAHGETAMVLWKDYRFQAVNPNPHPIQTTAKVCMEILFTHKNFVLIDEQSGEQVPHQIAMVARGFEINFPVSLAPFEQRSFAVQEIPAPALTSCGNFANYGADKVHDFAYDRFANPDWVCTPHEMITPDFHIRWEIGKGIVSIYDRKHDCELITPDAKTTAFQPIYEMTPIRTNPCNERRIMGRNRKNMHTQRDYGRLTDVEITDNGALWMRAVLTYEVAGSSFTQLVLTAYREYAKLDVDYRLHKDSVWAPENVYLSLPFAQENAELWADKLGCRFRPRIDQLPGACVDFYELQNGIVWKKDSCSVMVELPDAPMIAMGTLAAHDIRLQGDALMKNTDEVYAWVMNNFWETNFKVSLGGFHQYSYSLRICDTTDVNDCFETAKAENTGVLSFYSFDVPMETQV